MVDFDPRKIKKLTPRKVFIELLIIAVGLFLASRWNAMISEIIVTYFPEGQSLGEKVIMNGVITFLLVYFVVFMLKWDSKRSKGFL